ncbi:hypothetical protein GCM10019059_35970 [Camelimonas fluminis]|uniref:Invasion associated locus B family protein n=1 Tax=Camelimonas fluminis TaxID=1576911 RepID=A0ABV7UHM3_9HYPH|nr:invasion associated locus B family protein [Camelimonas fluminis]GHE73209.1 hypothetical protein GCM10019059_35970 [Camelimonas fluminis]
MQNSFPLLVTCSLVALTLNTAASIANQPQRAMTLPGGETRVVAPPPLMIEAGDWDAPSTTTSLFGEQQKPPAQYAPPRPAAAHPALPATRPQPAPATGPNAVAPKALVDNTVDSASKPAAAPSKAKPGSSNPAKIGPVAGASTAVDIGPVVKSLGIIPAGKLPPEISTPDIKQPSPQNRATIKPASSSQAKQAPRFTGSEGRAKPVDLAALKSAGTAVGDILDISRRFDDWTLACALRLDINERVCSIQQTIDRGADGSIEWKIATTSEGKAVVVFSFDDTVEPSSGFTVGISGFEKKIPATEWACKTGKCETSMLIIGPVAGWFSENPKISFAYSRSGKQQTLNASMAGFQKAMTASHNPLGTRPQDATVDVKPKSEKTALAR